METPLICPFIGRRCIKDKCMMWVRINISANGKAEVIDTCSIPMQLKFAIETQGELIRTQAGIDKLNNTLAQTGGRITAIMHRMAEEKSDSLHKELTTQTPRNPGEI